VQPTFQILNVGAGNSRKFCCDFDFLGLSEEMFDEGYQHITNIDISFTVVKQMQDLYREKYPTLTYKQMDVR
jgi:hypothetical protein